MPKSVISFLPSSLEQSRRRYSSAGSTAGSAPAPANAATQTTDQTVRHLGHRARQCGRMLLEQPDAPGERVGGGVLASQQHGHHVAGDPVVVESRPDHEITVPLMFRALTTERHLLPRLTEVGPDLSEEGRRELAAYRERVGSDPAP